MEILLPKSIDTVGKIIVGLAAAFVTYSVNEIRTDVKHLIVESNTSVNKIESMDIRVANLEQVVIFDRLPKSTSNNKETKQEPQKFVFIKNDDEEIKKWQERL